MDIRGLPISGAVVRPLRTCKLQGSAGGFTLAELLVVVVIVAAVAGAVTSFVAPIGIIAEGTGAVATLHAARDGVLGANLAPGYAADVGADPISIAGLLVRPSTVPQYDFELKRGWRGPYLRSRSGSYAVDSVRGFSAAYGTDGEPAVLDPWSRPIVLQIPDRTGTGGDASAEERRYARFVSAGADGILETPRTDASAAGNALLPPRGSCGDDVVLYLHVSDTRP